MSILDIFKSKKVLDSSASPQNDTGVGGVSYVDSSAYESENINLSQIAPIRTFDNMPAELSNIAYRNFSSWQNYAASVGMNNSLQQYSSHILNRLSYQECANLATDSMISKAIDVIDEASSKVRLKVSNLSPEGKELEKELRGLIKEKEDAIRNQEFEKASQLRDDEADLKEKIREMAQKYKEEHEANKPTVTAENVAEVISTMTGVPVTKLTEGESERLLKLEDTLHERVIGQHDAVVAISKAIRRARVGLKSPNRPIGSFIFCGPTGVGKTELAKALAEAVFGSEDNMIRVDMSEFMEKHSTAKLIGSPPGYVGYDDGGHLTELVRKKPYSVILFDEIEKAHPDVFNIMLQILDDGRLTDAKGRHVNFKNTIIIMTSNVGASMITTTSKLGFSTNEDESKDKYEKLKETVTEEMKKAFRPEFLNRIDETIVFSHLSQEEIRQIVDLMLKDLFKRLAERELSVDVTDEVKDHLAKNGYSEAYGARPLRRLIQRKIEDMLAEEILSGKYAPGDTIVIKLVDDKIAFEKKAKRARKEHSEATEVTQ